MALAPGGLTFNPSVISTYTAPTGSPGNVTPSGPLLRGEDGEVYYLSGTSDLRVINAATGVNAVTKTNVDVRNDANAAGVNTGSGFASSGSFACCVIPETPVFIVILGNGSGVSSDKRIVYYKINSSGALEVIGGYAGRTGGLNVTESPSRNATTAISALGFINSNPTNGSNNTIPYRYPIAVAYHGEARSTVFVCPSINFILANTPVTEVLSNHWLNREIPLSGSGFGANIFFVDGLRSHVVALGRGFFLPNSAGSQFCQMFFRQDLIEHNAGTASPTNSYLTIQAPTYLSGLISSVQINLTTDSTLFGWTAAPGAVVIPKHLDFRNPDLTVAYPFPDEGENFDGSAGTATDNFYCQPTVYPSDINDPGAPWFLFFPRIYRAPGDRDKIGLRVFAHYPSSGLAIELDFAKGQIWELGTDVPAGTFSIFGQVAVDWDRDTGDITLLARSFDIGESVFIVAEFGNFTLVEDSGGEPSDSGGPFDPGTFELRAWEFTQDGHKFYVLPLGDQGTWVLDLTTGEWAQWETTGYDGQWNARLGVEYNEEYVVGDLREPRLLRIDPESFFDDGILPIVRQATGVINHRGRDAMSNWAFRITASLGDPEPTTPASLFFSYSDNDGQTFTTPRLITIQPGNTSQELEFRSLGSIRRPGRIYNITDFGGFVRLEGANADIDGMDDE